MPDPNQPPYPGMGGPPGGYPPAGVRTYACFICDRMHVYVTETINSITVIIWKLRI